MNAISSTTCAFLLVVILVISSVVISNVKAQTRTITIPDNWSQVAIFAGDRSAPITTDSFTCNHAEWRIRWEAYLAPNIHFYYRDYILQITTYLEETSLEYIDFINANFSSINISDNLANGISYIHNNTGNFYLIIKTSPSIDSYRIYIEQNTDSSSTLPTPAATPTSSIDPEPFRFSSPNLIIAGTITLLIGLGILAYFKKHKGNLR